MILQKPLNVVPNIFSSYITIIQIVRHSLHSFVDTVKPKEFIRKSFIGHVDIIWIYINTYRIASNLLSNPQCRAASNKRIKNRVSRI